MTAVSTVGSVLVGQGLRVIGMSGAGVVQVFLVGVAITALLAGRASAVLAAALSVLAFNFFFVEPLHTFAVADPENLLIFGVLLVTGLVLSELVSRLRTQATAAQQRAETNRVLFSVCRALSQVRGVPDVLEVAEDAISDELSRPARIVPAPELLRTETALPSDPLLSTPPRGATRVHEARADAGHNLRVELSGTDSRSLGRLWLESSSHPPTEGDAEMACALAGVVTLALERELHAEESRRTAVEIERERLRTDLLSTVSHDLRTPLATITTSASALLDADPRLSADEREDLLRQVRSEASRLARLVENLLHLSRFDEGGLNLTTDLYPLQEIVEGALARLAGSGGQERVVAVLPDEPLWIRGDPELLVNALVNLLDNAIRYAPSDDVVLTGQRRDGHVVIAVEDAGPGFAGEPASFVARFARGPDCRQRGSGLGLSICAAIARAHGGTFEAENRAAGGARVALRLPAVDPFLESDDRIEPALTGRHT